MQRIFEDERRRPGGFGHGPSGWAEIVGQGVENARKWATLACAFLLLADDFGYQRSLSC